MMGIILVIGKFVEEDFIALILQILFGGLSYSVILYVMKDLFVYGFKIQLMNYRKKQ